MTMDQSNLPNNREATDNIWDALYTQRAIRYFVKDRKVPRELLEGVVEAGSKAPSGSNLQPWVFVVVDEQPIRASQRSAAWCLESVDQCWKNKERFIAKEEMQDALSAYEHARQAYRKLLEECRDDRNEVAFGPNP